MLHDDENAAASQQYFLLKKKKNDKRKKRRTKSSGKTIEQRQQRRMFYDSHCHLCKLGVFSAGATKSRRATKADPWPLLLRRSGANFPPNPALWLPRGLNFLCHGLGGSRIPKSPPPHSMSAR